MFKKVSVLLSVASACVAIPASAHVLYLAQRVSQPTLVIGFSSSDEAYDAQKIKDVKAFSITGESVPVVVTRSADHAVLAPASDAAVIVSTADYGFYARKQGAKWQKGKRSTLPGTDEGLHALKYNVAIEKPGASLTSHGLGLEIIPLEDPLTKKRGDHLAVRVLLQGKPLAGARIIENFLGNDSVLSAPTNAEGKTDITLQNDKLNVLALEYDQPVTNDKDINFNRYATSLSFSLVHNEAD